MRSLKKLEDLTIDQHNANRGTPRGSALIEASLRAYGAGRSIVADKNGVVMAGNKTLEKAAELGLAIKTVQTNGNELVVVQRTDLDITEPDGRGLAYLDNRAGELDLDWSPEQLQRDAEADLLPAGGWLDWELEAISAGERGALIHDHEAMIVVGEDYSDERGERAGAYLNTAVRQIVLIMDEPQYEAMVDRLDALRAAEPELETNYQAVDFLLSQWELGADA